jgi:hypothetical protein
MRDHRAVEDRLNCGGIVAALLPLRRILILPGGLLIPVTWLGPEHINGRIATIRADRAVPRRLTRLVLVVAAEPVLEFSFLTAPAWGAVEQPVVGHRRLEASGGRDVGPVDGAVL